MNMYCCVSCVARGESVGSKECAEKTLFVKHFACIFRVVGGGNFCVL